MMPPEPTPSGAPKLGILAGGGELPRLLIQACRAGGRDVFVLAFKNQCDRETADGVDHAWVRLGAAGKALDALKAAGVKELVMAGRIQKPTMAQLMPDARALKFLAGGAMGKGDDSLLRTIVEKLESQEGFRIVGVHHVMPELLAPAGVLGRIAPADDDARAIERAVHAARDLGSKDLGQAAVATADAVIALEERAGTDAMLEALVGNAAARGAVLAKMMKPGQEKRADLPTIGVATISNAAQAGLKGVVVEAGASLILERERVIAAADAAGVFVMGVTP